MDNFITVHAWGIDDAHRQIGGDRKKFRESAKVDQWNRRGNIEWRLTACADDDPLKKYSVRGEGPVLLERRRAK